MTRRSPLGLTILFVLLLGALLSSSAQAEQRAWECAPEAGEYSDAHCVTSSGLGSFRTVEIPNGVKTKVLVTNVKTAVATTAAAKSILKGTLSGLETEIECTNVGGSGEIENAESSVSGTATVEYNGCTVVKPAGRGCKVVGGGLTTTVLKLTTVGQTGTNLKISPASGNLGEITLENCLSNKPPNITYPVGGSLIVSTSGATATSTEAGITGQGSLTFGGNAAGLEGALTISKEGGGPITLASAVLSGSRAVTCVPDAEVISFGDAHCKEGGVGYVHKVIANGTETKLTGTNEKTAEGTTASQPSLLRGTLSGLETEIQCTGVSATGALTNTASSVSGTATIEYSGCTVPKPAGRGCKVKAGKITTVLLRAGTAGQGVGQIKVQPNSGTELASITLESCLNNIPPNTAYPVAGSLVASSGGATATTTEAEITSQKTLTFGGNAAGLEGALTFSKEGGSPIALT